MTTVTTSLTEERVRAALDTLSRYRSGKQRTDARIIEAEQWWKLRHWDHMHSQGNPADLRAPSAWLFNTIMSKHADAMDNQPDADILPREASDRQLASQLSAIVPCVLEQTDFPETFSSVMWQKLKYGAGVYGVFWDKQRLNGLGDISVRRIDLLNLFWEPGIEDIQASENVFLVESMDRARAAALWPEAAALAQPSPARSYVQDMETSASDRVPVIDWYYHTYDGPRAILHYAKLLGTHVLYASEDDPLLAQRGWYDHGLYPFVFDRLFPVEGSPVGFGYIDLCKGPQQQIDLLTQAVVKNALVTATPRYFIRSDGGINEQEFADLTRPIVHVTGSMSQESVSPVSTPGISGTCVSMLDQLVTQMKDTTGNTNSSNGVTSGVTSASGIAALQEAAGKLSRDSSLGSFRAFTRVVRLIIELIRQFYDAPRCFRILGPEGTEQFTAFSNAALRPQPLGTAWGEPQGYRLPVFDIKVSAEAHSAFTRNAINEQAMSLFGMGVFDPANAEKSLLLLELMQFEGKEALMQKLRTLHQQALEREARQQALAQAALRYRPGTPEAPAAGPAAGPAAAAPNAPAPAKAPNADPSKTAPAKAAKPTVTPKHRKDPGGARTKADRARKVAAAHTHLG